MDASRYLAKYLAGADPATKTSLAPALASAQRGALRAAASQCDVAAAYPAPGRIFRALFSLTPRLAPMALLNIEELILSAEKSMLSRPDVPLVMIAVEVYEALGKGDRARALLEKAVVAIPGDEELGKRVFLGAVKLADWAKASEIASTLAASPSTSASWIFSAIQSFLLQDRAADALPLVSRITAPYTSYNEFFVVSTLLRRLWEGKVPMDTSALRHLPGLSPSSADNTTPTTLDSSQDLSDLLVTHWSSSEAERWCAESLAMELLRREIQFVIPRARPTLYARLHATLAAGDTNWHTIVFLIRTAMALDPHERRFSLRVSKLSDNDPEVFAGPEEKNSKPEKINGETELRIHSVQTLLNSLTATSSERGYQLGLLEIAALQAREHPASIVSDIIRYARRYSHKACCFDDLRVYLAEPSCDLDALRPLVEAELAQIEVSLESCERHLTWSKLAVYLIPPGTAAADLTARATALFSVYLRYLELSQRGVSETERQPGDGFALLAAQVYVLSALPQDVASEAIQCGESAGEPRDDSTRAEVSESIAVPTKISKGNKKPSGKKHSNGKNSAKNASAAVVPVVPSDAPAALDSASLMKAAFISHFALQHSAHAFELRLLLIQLYLLLGAPSLALFHYDKLQIKSIQNETLSHLIASRGSTLVASKRTNDAQDMDRRLHEVTSHIKYGNQEAHEMVLRAFERGNYYRVADFAAFETRLSHGITLAEARIERIRIASVNGLLDNSGDAKAAQGLSETGPFNDNRDFDESLPTYLPEWAGTMAKILERGPTTTSEWVIEMSRAYVRGLTGEQSVQDTEKGDERTSEKSPTSSRSKTSFTLEEASLIAFTRNRDIDALVGTLSSGVTFKTNAWSILHAGNIALEALSLIDAMAASDASLKPWRATAKTSLKVLSVAYNNHLKAIAKAKKAHEMVDETKMKGISCDPSRFVAELHASQKFALEGLAAAMHKRAGSR